MNRSSTDSRRLVRLVGAVLCAFGLASIGAPVEAAETDISSTPIVSTNPAAVKPNIMLLLDTSDSMAWTHMPDDVEGVLGVGKYNVGYKSSECNVLYYDPTKSYLIPKRYDGTYFSTPVFTSAPIAGFGEFYPTPFIDTLDLSSQFVAYDGTGGAGSPPEHRTLKAGGDVDTAQPAYYFTHSSGAQLNYATLPCTVPDTTSPGVGATLSDTQGGTWTKNIVSATSGVSPHVDERQNFAIWFSFYRTRISLIKSAASLAFTPLTDSFRVGYISVLPYEPTDTHHASVSANRFLAVNDFNNTQRQSWFTKLFQQSPYGSSPTREGLARVGRYYAGKENSINTGMAATGTNDPLQYSCQQNFAIVTTDGNWNNQDESDSSIIGGTSGGALQMDGSTKIGQADGGTNCPVTDPFCPRPIFDGGPSSVQVVRDASNFYDQISCGLATQTKNIFQPYTSLTSATASYQNVPRRTQTWAQTVAQTVIQTQQTTKRVQTTQKTTEQYSTQTHVVLEDKYQVQRSQFHYTKTTQQQTFSKQHQTEQTVQTSRVDTQVTYSEVQYKEVRQQWAEVRVQNQAEQRRYSIEQQQTVMHVYRVSAKPKNSETYLPAASCTEDANTDCLTYELCFEDTSKLVSAPGCASHVSQKAVDPSTCTASSVGTTSPYIHTDCIAGPLTVAKATTPSCAPYPVGTTAPTGPTWVTTICSDDQINPPHFVQTCAPTTDSSNIRTICTTPAGANNTTNIGTSTMCAGSDGSVDPFVHVTCNNNLNETTYPPTACTSTVEAGNITRTCTQPINILPTNLAGSCSDYALAEGLTVFPNDVQLTCNTTTTNRGVVAPSACPSTAVVTTGVGSPYKRTCTTIGVGTFPSVTTVPWGSCTPTDGESGDNTRTICNTVTDNTNTPIQSGTCANADGTATPYGQVVCSYLANANNASGNVVPGGCSNTDGSTPPYLTTTCAGPIADGAVQFPVDPLTCQPMGDTVGSNNIVTRCTKIPVAFPPDEICHAGNTGPNDWIQTDCANNDGALVPSPPCTVGPSTDGTSICSKTIDLHNIPVAGSTCTVADTPPTSQNNYVHTQCVTTDTFPLAAVDPSNCTNPGTTTSPSSPFATTTCTTTGVGLYPSPTPIDAANCHAGTDSFFVVTSCSNGPDYSATATPTTACVNGTTTAFGPASDHAYATCVATDVSDFTYVGGCSSTLIVGTTVTCGTPTTALPDATVPSCNGGNVVGSNPPVTVSCSTATVTVPAISPACVDHDDANYHYTCTQVLQSSTPDSSCMESTQTGSPYQITHCVPGVGSGKKLRVATTTTTTTSNLSGMAVVGTPNVVTNPGSPVEITACLAPTDPTVQVPTNNPVRPGPTDNPPPPAGCTAWGNPGCVSSTAGPSGSQNSLADVASYYYKNDLRPDNTLWPNNVKPAGPGAEDDNAPHQHMTTFVIGLGVSGTLAYRSDYRSLATTTGDFAKLRLGTLDWPIWPDPAITYDTTDKYDDPRSIDDFWHTAVDGRGLYFSAQDPASVVTGLGNALSAINVQTASGAGDGASTLQPVAGNNFAYTSSYQTGSWVGDLQAFTINLNTGGLDATPLWSARDLIHNQTGNACDNRNVYLLELGGELTSGGGQNLVDFSWNTFACDSGGSPTGLARNNLNQATDGLAFAKSVLHGFSNWPSMTDGSLGTVDQQSAAAGANLVNFIRGQRGNEGFVANSLTKLYRPRADALGDLVGSQPIFVGTPFAKYSDPGYAGFITTEASRTPAVYVGGNDGMLHAFKASTGDELWAVIPHTVLSDLWRLGDANYKDFHHFFVDGSPVVGDVYDAVNGHWHTLLVGGLNAGGRGYYALDVTTPESPKALWEFQGGSGTPCPAAAGSTGDCNLGLTFGLPVITKVAGNWVVLFTSGYNNDSNGGDGGGYLYAVDAMTGKIVFRISTGQGIPGTPSGLAQINAFVENTFVDNTALRAYGGDQLGDIWRFELSPTPSAQLLGNAVTSGGLAQPITTRPEISELNNVPMVIVGTGELLGATDVGNVETQSIYSFNDPLTAGPVYADLRAALRPLVMTQHGTGAAAVRTIACTDTTACARTAGWVLDLPEAGERINIAMKLNFGTLIAASNVPKAESCTVGGHSWFNFLDYRTGLAVDGSATVDLGDGTSGKVTSTYIADSLTAGFNIYQLPPSSSDGGNTGRFVVGFHESDTSHPVAGAPPPSPLPLGKRISWREIFQ